ncbi:MAG: hypothetical protein K1X47_08585 [Cyclobacteriaceae bacterium]|nr:hypothetical protein [Cyclobacteriaceae bacterium]
MNKRHYTDQQLLDHIDGLRVLPMETLRQSPADLERLNVLLKIQKVLSSAHLEAPSAQFTARVMSRLHQSVEKPGVSYRNGIWLLMGVLVAVFVMAGMLSGGFFDSFSGQLPGKVMPIPGESFKLQLPEISWSGKVILEIIVVINVALALFMLDRAVLRPYFLRRRLMHH